MKRIHNNDSGFLVEQCQQVAVDDYVRRANQKLKKELITMQLEIEGLSIRLTTSKLAHGGFRYWFSCPGCQRRCGKLYKHPVTQILACRKCNGLEYRCRRYKEMIENNTYSQYPT